MCGIAGVYNTDNTIDRTIFDEMVDIVAYRGPDGRGTYFAEDDHLALGHRRLAIIETNESGAQPFSYQDRHIIVFNGEIYNYIELRAELKEAGYSFSTKTDTEVLVASYDHWGEECVNRFNGMWAFAIYDKTKRRIFCSRDRFGIKPFYYQKTEKLFAFSSEIKQILCLNEVSAKANRDVLIRFLMLGMQDYSEQTMFEGINCLLPGHNIRFDLETKEFTVYEYHQLVSESKHKKSFEEDCKDFHRLFMNSVKLRLRADVPVGYCLSGGLDSSSIVCTADKLLAGKGVEQHTISSCFENPEYDEQEYIDEVVRSTSVTPHKVFPDINKVLDEVDDIIFHMDEPFGSTSIYSQWNVFREAKKQGLTVMLDGQGADEQLAGYSHFYMVRFAELIKRFRFIQFYREYQQCNRLRASQETYTNWREIVGAAIFAALPMPGFVRKKVRIARALRGISPFSDEQIKCVYQTKDQNHVGNTSAYILEYVYGGMQRLLHYEDRDSMAFSIESRVPFLDYQLAETLYQMPFDRKIRNGITKAVLREGLRDILPEKIAHRYSKLGFESPEDEWMNNHRDLIEQELRKAADALHPILNAEDLIKWYRYLGQVKRDDPIVWRIICAGRWKKVFQVDICD